MFDPMDIIKLTQNLGIIQAVRDKLTVQEDPSAKELADVLDELTGWSAHREYVIDATSCLVER